MNPNDSTEAANSYIVSAVFNHPADWNRVASNLLAGRRPKQQLD